MLHVFHPDTVVRWHRLVFRRYWTAKSRRIGRPPIDRKLRKLIREMQSENVGWGAPRSPWQNPYVERAIGSFRRDCLNHVIVVNEGQLRRLLGEYVYYYHGARTHLSLNNDSPVTRPVAREQGNVVAFPKVGGLHHRYERLAA